MKTKARKPVPPPPADEAPAPLYNPFPDGHAAKLWELLRRSKAFQERAKEILTLANSSNNDDRYRANEVIGDVASTNPFAATTLRWLCNEPRFKITMPQRVDGTNREGQATKWDLVWEGFDANPPPLTVPESQATAHCARVDGQPLHPGWGIEDDCPEARWVMRCILARLFGRWKVARWTSSRFGGKTSRNCRRSHRKALGLNRRVCSAWNLITTGGTSSTGRIHSPAGRITMSLPARRTSSKVGVYGNTDPTLPKG